MIVISFTCGSALSFIPISEFGRLIHKLLLQIEDIIRLLAQLLQSFRTSKHAPTFNLYYIAIYLITFQR